MTSTPTRTVERAAQSLPHCDDGYRIDVAGLTRTVRGGLTVLSDVAFSVQPGELVAVVGGSGAGKTTLLEAVAGVRPPTGGDTGTVTYNGAELLRNLDAVRASMGYLPQDDIIHKDLPLRTTLRYAAELRLAGPVTKAQIDERVSETLGALDLTQRADVRVGSLSRGQRRRASIGVELLTGPGMFFLDEPTSGLDPSTGADIMRLLRRLADAGSTVLLTTYAPEDIRTCDKVLFLARGGRLAFFDSPAQAREDC